MCINNGKNPEGYILLSRGFFRICFLLPFFPPESGGGYFKIQCGAGREREAEEAVILSALPPQF